MVAGVYLVMFRVKNSQSLVFSLVMLMLASFASLASYAQTTQTTPNIDPRLTEIVESVKQRAINSKSVQLRYTPDQTAPESNAKRRLQAAKRIQEAAYSKAPDEIRDAINAFKKVDSEKIEPSMDRIAGLYMQYVELLNSQTSVAEQQLNIAKFKSDGSWVERYFATQLSMQLYAASDERQAAFQKAQQAFKLIPNDETQKHYTQFARADTASNLAQLHNLQGNIDFAIINSLEYLALSKGERDAKSAIDIINNLIFSHSLNRDHEASLYLSEQLLEIEKISSSTVPGLTEYRVAQAANMSGNFTKGLEYSQLAIEKSQHPQINKFAKTSEAVALAGLGRKEEAMRAALASDIDLDPENLLTIEPSKNVIYLAFLLAQGEDDTLARKLYNRQLDVTAQKFLANNSRDTTAMVAELENSRERQLEREAASAREAELQAMTIDRQRKLNRSLILLVILLAGVAIGLLLLMKAREKLLRKLEIKTVEAASAEKLKTEFLGMISHELRTPLNGIIGISDFLANYHEDSDIRKKTDIILRSGNELLSVVESLTDMARLDAGQLELLPHDANLSLSLAAVPELWAEKAQEKGLTFTHFLDPQIAQYKVDEDRLIQCLNILLANAISFTDAGRVHLHITAEQTEEDGVVGLTAIVADTGQGMTELVQSRLFTPFMQADSSRKRTHMGTGLSLAIAHALVEMMGGRLSVNSRAGRGSEFKLYIPLAAVTRKTIQIDSHATVSSGAENNAGAEGVEDTPVYGVPSLETPQLERFDGPQVAVVDLMQPPAGFPSLHDVDELVLPTPAGGRHRILVVDDMNSNRDVLRMILETQGHRCSEAADGYAALAALERQAFDLVVLDIHMAPLDGVETLRRLRGSGKPHANIPVIALTADNAASTNAACMDAGADLFLTKPVSQGELLRAISYLHQTEGARILSR